VKRSVVFGMVFLAFCGCNRTVNRPTVIQDTRINVRTVCARIEKYTPSLVYSGSILPAREANLGVTIPGRVENHYFSAGAVVKKGQLLVDLSNELLVQAEIENSTLLKDFERVARLYQKKSLPEQQYDHVKAQYEASNAKCELLRKNTEIRAPFDGMIVEYLVQEGENFFFAPGIDPGYSHTSGIVRLMQIDTIKAECTVNEKDFPKIFIGQTARVQCDAYPDKEFRGTVTEIEPILSMLSRAAAVRVTVANPALLIKPGMFCRLILDLPVEEQIMVPLIAVSRQAGTGEDYVYVVDDNKAHRVTVTKLATVADRVAVAGLPAGSLVVIDGKSKLQEGSPLNIVN